MCVIEVSRIQLLFVFDTCTCHGFEFPNCSVSIKIVFRCRGWKEGSIQFGNEERHSRLPFAFVHTFNGTSLQTTRLSIPDATTNSIIHQLGTWESQPWPLPDRIMDMDQFGSSPPLLIILGLMYNVYPCTILNARIYGCCFGCCWFLLTHENMTCAMQHQH